jgi:uroporphyrinogen-III decarboxylase
MNTRERFLAWAAFEPDVLALKWEYGYWAGVVRQWEEEGLHLSTPLPESMGDGGSVRAEVMGYKGSGFVDEDIHALFGLEAHQRRVPVNNFIYPLFEEEILEETPDSKIFRDGWGIVRQVSKEADSPDKFVRTTVACREDWEQLKAERLQVDTAGRLPENWAALCEGYPERDYPLIIGGGQGFFGSPRYLLGDVEVLTTFYDAPELIHAINSHLCDFWIALYDRVLQDVQPDAALIWEDMCYKNGPLISPAMFEEFMLPYYKKLCGFFKDQGIDIILVDTDGDARKLLPLFLEGGVTGTFPIEVAAGMHVAELREAFPTLQLIGGVDKLALMKDKAAIDAELDERILPTLEKGGFIPTVDHLVPPDVSWENFSYYRRRLNDAIDELEARQ